MVHRIAAAAVACLALTLSACGSKDDRAPAAGAETAPAPQAEPARPPVQMKTRVLQVADPAKAAVKAAPAAAAPDPAEAAAPSPLVGKVRALKDRACACKDKACAGRVQDEVGKVMGELGDVPAADRKAVGDAMQALQQCIAAAQK